MGNSLGTRVVTGVGGDFVGNCVGTGVATGVGIEADGVVGVR